MTNLVSALQEEIQRNRELLLNYAEIGQVGNIARKLIEHDIKNALDFMAYGDTVGMLQIYQTLKENK